MTVANYFSQDGIPVLTFLAATTGPPAVLSVVKILPVIAFTAVELVTVVRKPPFKPW